MGGQAPKVAFSLVMVIGLALVGIASFAPIRTVKEEVSGLNLSSVLLNNFNPLWVSSIENLRILPLQGGEAGGEGGGEGGEENVVVKVVDVRGNPIENAYVFGISKVSGFCENWMTSENGTVSISPEYTFRIIVGKENYYPYLGEFENVVVLKKFQLTGDSYPVEFGLFGEGVGWVIFRGILTSDFQGFFENRVWNQENGIFRVQGSQDGISLIIYVYSPYREILGYPMFLTTGCKVLLTPESPTNYKFLTMEGGTLYGVAPYVSYYENVSLRGGLRVFTAENLWYLDSEFTLGGKYYYWGKWYSKTFGGSVFGKAYFENSDLVFEGDLRTEIGTLLPIRIRIVGGKDLVTRFVHIPTKMVLGVTGLLFLAVGMIGMAWVPTKVRR